jgi:hypothetical protein
VFSEVLKFTETGPEYSPGTGEYHTPPPITGMGTINDPAVVTSKNRRNLRMALKTPEPRTWIAPSGLTQIMENKRCLEGIISY